MKKILAVLLSLCVIITTAVCAAPTTAAVQPGRTEIPVVYLCGTGNAIYRKDENGNVEQLYPFVLEDGFVSEKAEVFLPVFAKAFFTQQWDEFCQVLCGILNEVLSSIKLDKNGEASDGSYVDWSWSREGLWDKKSNGTYGMMDYEFCYDWRLSPMVIADDLHRYIEDVCYVTGAEQVALVGRCYGSTVVAAYMEKYGGQHIKEVVHYASAADGAMFMSKIFTGEARLHANGIERLMYDLNLDIEPLLNELLLSFVTLFNKTYGLDIVCWAVNNVFKDIYIDIIPDVLTESFGTLPSYWSMVCPEDYEKAKETVYYGSDITEYAGLIAKTDDYYNNVQKNLAENIAEYEKMGIEFSNIVKYGKQDAPVTTQADDMSDFLIIVKDASYGAATTPIGKTFNKAYLQAAEAGGTVKYISPEKMIDASTCVAPDTTWFIKDLDHFDFPDVVNNLISEIVNNDGFTVESSEEYPQYLLYNEENITISPLTAENMDTTPEWNTSFFEAFKKFFDCIFELIRNAISAKTEQQ